jgi:glycosyltransferase involved in cell wall biosynthesis
MSAREDPSVVVEALGRSDAPLGKVALVLTGPDRFGSEHIRQAIEGQGLTERVLIAGFVDDADLVPLIAGAAALVHPSRDEGFGFTPLEAMAVGTPVIASDAGSLPEVAGGGALLADPDDVGAWRDAIEAVTGDRAVRDRLVASGRAHQAQFTWERTARGTVAFYDEVLGAL